MTNGDKLEELYKLIYGNNSLDELIGEEKKKKVTRGLDKIYHPDIFLISYDEEKRKDYLNKFYGVFSDLDTGSRDSEEVIKKIFEIKANYDLEYGKSEDKRRSKDSVKEALNERFEALGNEFSKFKGLINYGYKWAFRKIDTASDDKNLDDILDYCYDKILNIIRSSILYDNILLDLESKINEICPKDERGKFIKTAIRDKVINFEKLIYVNEGKPEITSIKKLNDAYYDVYSYLKKILTNEEFNKRAEFIVSNSPELFDGIIDNFYNEVMSEKINSDDIKIGKDPVVEFDTRLKNTTNKFELEMWRRKQSIEKYLDLKNKIVERGYKESDISLDVSSLLNCSDEVKCEKKYMELLPLVELELDKLDFINLVKNKGDLIPSYVMQDRLDNYISKINSCVNREGLDYIKKVILKELDYLIYVNNSFDEYIKECEKDEFYSFSLEKIKKSLDSKRGDYDPLDGNYQKFLVKFRLMKDELREIAKEDQDKANKKKEFLKKKFMEDTLKGIFVSDSFPKIEKEIDNISTFGGFADFENRIIMKEMDKVVKDVVVYLKESSKKMENSSYSVKNINFAYKLLNQVCEILDKTSDYNKIYVDEEKCVSYRELSLKVQTLKSIDYLNDDPKKIDFVLGNFDEFLNSSKYDRELLAIFSKKGK